MKVTKEEVEELVEEIQDWGCHCDIMIGYSCGHSQIERIIKNLFQKAGVNFES
jgi:hypothetical protein